MVVGCSASAMDTIGRVLGTTLLAITASAYAQRFRFEVTTVKPSPPDIVSSDLNVRDDGLEWKNVPMTFMLQYAYRLSTGSDDQFIGGPAWLRSKRFDVVGKEDAQTQKMLASLSSGERDAELRVMMQGLLAERFELKVHREPRPLKVLVLSVAKGGPKLKPAMQEVEGQWSGLHNDGSGHVDGRSTRVGDLVNVLSSMRELGGRLVLDQTGLTGRYDFTLRYAPEQESGAGDGPGLFAALQEQLGLRLASTKAPVDCVVIDRIALPTAN